MLRRVFLFVLALGAMIAPLVAQPGDPPDDPGEPVPFSGLIFLVASGIILGVRMINGKKKEQ